MLEGFMSGFTYTFQIIAAKWQLTLGLVALAGLLIQRAPSHRVFQGVVKTVVGVMILQVGAATLLASFRPALSIIQEAFKIKGIVMDPYGGWTAALAGLGAYAGYASQVMVVGFVVNLLIAKYTRLKFVYLSLHTMLAFCCFVSWMLFYVFHASPVQIVLCGSVIAGIYWSVLPAIVHRYSRQFVGDQFTLGHMSGMAAVIGSVVGRTYSRFSKDKKESDPVAQASTLEFKGWLSIFNDNVVATSLIMTVFLSLACLLSGKALVSKYAGADNWIVYSLLLGFSFAVGINILLTGVRMMLAEIVPAFRGISEKIIPGAIPAMDMPVFFPFAPTAVVLGFLSTLAGEMAGLGFLFLVHSPIITIPGVIPTFFDGGMMGVFANYFGKGKKGPIILSGLIIGTIQVAGAAMLSHFSNLPGAIYPNTDYDTIWVGLSAIMKYSGSIWIFMAIYIAIAIVVGVLISRKSPLAQDSSIGSKAGA